MALWTIYIIYIWYIFRFAVLSFGGRRPTKPKAGTPREKQREGSVKLWVGRYTLAKKIADELVL